MSTEPQELKLSRVGQVGIMVKELETAVAFYRDKLGIKHLFTASGMAFFELGDLRLMLGQAYGPENLGSSTFLYYKVDDIHKAYETFKARGVAAVEDPELAHRAPGMELWLATLKDMDSNPVLLMCEKRTA
jgi:methylmalonyl-CoA/ethylmalonyl-CoA epimerase